MMVNITFAPNPESVIRRLQSFSSELQNKALSSGLSGAAAPIKKRMKQLVPVQPGGGALKRSIGHRQLSVSARARIGVPADVKAVIVGPIRRVADPKYKRNPGSKIQQGFKAYWMEYGTKGGYTIPKKSDKFVNIGGNVRREVTHPGVRSPSRFVSRSFDQTRSQVEKAFFVALSKRLDKLGNA